jgi:hypothetical protein
MSNSGIKDVFLRWDNQVTSPWTSLSRRVYPRTVQEVFAWAEELWMHHGIYSSAIRKAVRYFMTEVDIKGDELSREERLKYIESINTNFDMKEDVATIGDDFIGFGNAFTSLHIPFTRDLICPHCAGRAPLKEWKGSFQWHPMGNDPHFTGTCIFPSCKKTGRLEREDKVKPEGSYKPFITRWPPQYMEVKYHPLSGRKLYSLDTTKYELLRQGIQTGDMLYLEDTRWEIIEAVVSNRKFEFEEDQIYHMAYPVAAGGIPTLRGWGLPPFMNEFETALLVTMLDKYTESIIVDYLVPFRVLTPPAGNGAPETDPLLQVDMGNWQGQVRQMLARHRRNPTGWNFLPFPMEYQVLGGEAQDLAPIEIQQHYEARLLHSMGIPQEFYSSSFSNFGSNNAGPMLGFKMFEREWQYFANQLNKWMSWLINKQGEMMKWEKVTAELLPVSMHEDPEIRDIKLQLAAAGEISKRTAYRPLGIDPKAERRAAMDEDEEFQEEVEKRSKELEKKQVNTAAATPMPPGAQILQQDEAAAMAAGGGGAPMPAPMGAPALPQGGAPSMGGTMDELIMQAQTMAEQLFYLPDSQRRSELINLKNSNEALHAQVKAALQDMDTQARQKGVEMARQKGGGMPPAA